MADDLINMPEFDENDPDMKVWMDAELTRQKKFFAGKTRDEVMADVEKLIADKKQP